MTWCYSTQMESIEGLEKRNIMCKLGCRAGKLDEWFPFNVFNKTDLVNDFTKDMIPTDGNGEMIVLSKREAIRTLSKSRGQVF